MKIVHLTYDMRIGGTEMVIKGLVEGSVDRFDVEILCLEPRLGPFGEHLVEQGIKVTNLNWLGGFNVDLIKGIRQYIKENDVDILHCHQYTPWVYGTLASLFCKTKVIFTEHGRFYPDSSSNKRKIVNPILTFFTEHISAISSATKQALVEYEFLPERKIEVIYNGIKPLQASKEGAEKLRAELGIASGAKIFGTIARLDPIKNQRMMINAFAELHKEQSDVVLVIVGDGEERKPLESQVSDLDITDAVFFTGYKDKPAEYLALMDIFLLSSLSEGTSMTLLEAMSLGKPCVVTDAGGNPEIIIDKKNGLVTPNDNQSAFAKAMKDILNPDLINTFANNAKIRFQENFTLQNMVNSYVELYKNN
ncbi:glycosyltransferase [Catenovulum sp. SM1970]|nr:glycosyltransferase [Marinifaba aquimaris]NTS78278.1 glycosyltransferase [Marinifaba aquimaris]